MTNTEFALYDGTDFIKYANRFREGNSDRALVKFNDGPGMVEIMTEHGPRYIRESSFAGTADGYMNSLMTPPSFWRKHWPDFLGLGIGTALSVPMFLFASL